MDRTVSALAVVALLAGCAGGTGDDPPDRPASTVVFGERDALLYVQVADEVRERRQGLMGVESLPSDQGMAFVFDGPVTSTFWMKDTLVPLSIAFVDESGRVIEVLDMQPCEVDACPRYRAEEPYVLAIEANLGWFDGNGVEVGDRAELRESPYG